MSIRQIEYHDIDFIIECLYALRVESPFYRDRSSDEDHTRKWLTAMISSEDFIGIIDPNKGLMLGCAAETWYSPDRNAYEELLYIKPEMRGGTSAARLIRRFCEMSKNRNCLKCIAAVATHINADRTETLYKRLGFTQHGRFLIRSLV